MPWNLLGRHHNKLASLYLMQDLLLLIIIFIAVFTQSVAGFGSALIAMAALTPLLGIQVSAPLVALVTFVLEIFLLVYYREALKIQNIWKVVFASVIGVPLGVIYLKQVDEKITMTLLGLLITAYAVYALLQFRLPRLEHSIWAYITGFTAGLLGGAYNTSGPPVIIYGNCREWEPAEFKANLQGFFLISSLLVAASHLFGGNVTSQVWRGFLLSIPALTVGMIFGIFLDKRIRPDTFRKIVLVLLIILGLRLVFSFI